MTPPRPTTVARVVVRSPNWLGDAVMALPAMAAIRRHFANSHLVVAALPSVAPVFRERTAVAPDRVIEVPRAARAAAALIEGEGFDLGILLPNSFRSAWVFRRARVPQRWGVARAGRGLLLTRRVRRPRAPGGLHQADYYRRLVAALGVPCAADEMPWIVAEAPSEARALALLAQHGVAPDRPLVGLAPGAAYGQAKQWAPARMAELAVRLVHDRDATAVVVGASHDRDAARTIESWVRAHAPEVSSRIVNLTGHTSLGALMGVMARAAVFVSNDSGAMHLASALGCPVVAIFGPTDDRITRPLGEHSILKAPVFCRPCHLRDCPIDHRCMKRVTVDDVYGAVVEQIDTAGGAE